VDEEQGGTGSFIDIMDAVALDLHKAALERVELLVEPRRALRCARNGGGVVARDRNVC
jgi:hypothetical protein